MKTTLKQVCVTAVITLGLGSGCSQSEDKPQQSQGTPVKLLSRRLIEAPAGEMFITATRGAGPEAWVQYEIGGSVFQSPGTPEKGRVDGGPMRIGEHTLEFNPELGDVYRSSEFPGAGTELEWALEGNPELGIPGWSASLYIPSEIMMLSPEQSGEAISLSSPPELKWNPDERKEGNVNILIAYDAETSREKNPELPAEEWSRSIEVPDTGNYQLTPEDLADLAPGSYVQLLIGRGSGGLGGSEEAPFHIYGYSTAGGTFRAVD